MAAPAPAIPLPIFLPQADARELVRANAAYTQGPAMIVMAMAEQNERMHGGYAAAVRQHLGEGAAARRAVRQFLRDILNGLGPEG